MTELEKLEEMYRIVDFLYRKWNDEDSVEKNFKDILEDLHTEIEIIKYKCYY